MRVGVIDCGTNTFHLLIADIAIGSEVIYHTEQIVRLGEEGLHTIGKAAVKRALDVLVQFADTCQSLEVLKVRAVGTAAFRTASNSEELIEAVKVRTGIEINIINGDIEALLIYKGIANTLPDKVRGNFLIMDIGGGSSEFIIGNYKSIIWKTSLPLGAAILKAEFQDGDIITEKEVEHLDMHLKKVLMNVFKQIKQNNVTTLIGASGSFDTLADIVNTQKEITVNNMFNLLNMVTVENIIKLLIALPLNQRQLIPGMNPTRADMMPMSAILINSILKNALIDTIYTTKRALKDGVLLEMLSEYKVSLN